jgi:hypothetical protein
MIAERNAGRDDWPNRLYFSPGIALLLLAVAVAIANLPDVHAPVPARDGHYTSPARVQQADVARQIIANPNSPCRWYSCSGSKSGSMLRVCDGDALGLAVKALQWVYYTGSEWVEGTAFTQDKPQKVENYLQNNGCREVVK